MSFIKKSDVKRHLSTGSGTSLYPSARSRRDAAAPVTKTTETEFGIALGHPISPDGESNAQVRGSLGIPANAGRS